MAAWKRLASWGVDGAVAVVVILLTSMINDLLGAVVLLCGVPAYYVLLVGRKQVGTLGHQLLGLTVIDDRTDGPPDELRAALRLAVGVALLIPFAIPAVLSAVAMFRTGAHKAWHDLASQTTVISKR